MSSSKKIDLSRAFAAVMFIKVYRLEIQSVMLVFSTQLCLLLPLWPSLWFNSTSPLPCVKVCRQYLAGRGWGMLSPAGDHILQEINTLYLTRFRTYQIARPPDTNT
jgi:hypothetical protein